jgi:hypothetical protein
MADTQVWVSPYGENGWRTHQNSRTLSIKDLKTEAIAYARTYSRSYHNTSHVDVELIVQRKDGSIEFRETYGKDPFPPRG